MYHSEIPSGRGRGFGLGLFVILLLTLSPNQISLPIGNLTMGGVDWPEQSDDVGVAGVEELGKALVDVEQYVVPFEVASVLLLVAMIGAVYIVFPKRDTAPAQWTSCSAQAGGGGRVDERSFVVVSNCRGGAFLHWPIWHAVAAQRSWHIDGR